MKIKQDAAIIIGSIMLLKAFCSSILSAKLAWRKLFLMGVDKLLTGRQVIFEVEEMVAGASTGFRHGHGC